MPTTATSSTPSLGAPVTGLEPDRRRPGAVIVSVGGVPYCTVPAEAAAGLAVGMVLDEPLAGRLGAAADEEGALRLALRLLARRPFARRDLGVRLTRKGHPAVAVEAALGRVERLGLLDDARFARDYVEAYRRRGRGPIRIAAELGRLGVAREHVQAALADGGGLDGSLAEARRLAERRLGSLAGLAPAAVRRRLLAFLARRGYTGAEVRRVVAALVRSPGA